MGFALVPEVNRITASSLCRAGIRGSPGWHRDSSPNSVSGSGLAEAAEAQAWRRGLGQQIVKLQAVLIQNELRLEPLENIAELIAIHLDVDGANGGAGGHHAEIAEQMFDRIVGKKRNAVVGTEAALAQQCGEASDGFVQCAVADRAAVVGRHHPWFVRRALRGARDPVQQQV